MHPALLDTRPGKTIDISFSLRQDPLEQALFGEYIYIYMQSINAIYIYAICKCNLYMQFIYAIYICNQYMQSMYAIYIYMQSIYAIYIYIYMQPIYAV